MSKKILVLYYSQTGQLTEIVETFTAPIRQAGISVETIRAQPQNDFDFPWNGQRFFDAMPESVLGIPAPLKPLQIREDKYDLVVFAYQPWFLSLSIPANSILADERVKKIIKNTPVITLIGARNMWLSSQEKLKIILTEAGAKLVGTIALVDTHSNLVSAVTILHWMMNGKKESYLGVFPKPGVPDEEIARATGFGHIVARCLNDGKLEDLQQQLVNEKAVEVHTNLMFIEERAPRLFYIWAKLIVNSKHRQAWLVVFKYYLLFALFIIAPLVLSVYTIFFRPFLKKSISRKKRYYLGLQS